MACETLNIGRTDYSCMTLVGGLKNVYFAAYTPGVAALAVDATTGELTFDAAIDPVFKFELVNDGNTFEESSEANDMAGTSIFSQTGTFVLKSIDAETGAELQLLAKSRLHVFVEDMNGNVRLAGKEFGAACTVGSFTGGAIGDASGYNVGISARDLNIMPHVDITDEVFTNALSTEVISPE